MTSYWGETRACPNCHHTGHVVSDHLETFKLWYGQVRRPALNCPHCSCKLPMALPGWLLMKWKGWKSAEG